MVCVRARACVRVRARVRMCVSVTKKYVYSHKTRSDIIMKNVNFL